MNADENEAIIWFWGVIMVIVLIFLALATEYAR